MQGEFCIISLVSRTIGAERGRAARGRPISEWRFRPLQRTPGVPL